MIFGVKKLVSYLSQFFTLHPGDIISTGTPVRRRHGHASRPSSSAPAKPSASASKASANNNNAPSPTDHRDSVAGLYEAGIIEASYKGPE